MLEDWVVALGAIALLAASAVLFRAFAERGAKLTFANEREEQLARKLADQLNCPLGAALAAVRRELDIAPNQSDETILKRAAYHYRQSQPEPGPCRTYRDRAPR